MWLSYKLHFLVYSEYTKNEKPRCIFSNLALRASCQSHCCVFIHSFKLHHYSLFIEGWLKTLV